MYKPHAKLARITVTLFEVNIGTLISFLVLLRAICMTAKKIPLITDRQRDHNSDLFGSDRARG